MTSSHESRQVQRVLSPPPDARPAFREMFEENFDYVWNTLRHLGARTADLEDLASVGCGTAVDVRLDSLATAGKVQSFGRGRARRWLTPPVPGFPTILLLPGPLPSD